MTVTGIERHIAWGYSAKSAKEDLRKVALENYHGDICAVDACITPEDVSQHTSCNMSDSVVDLTPREIYAFNIWPVFLKPGRHGTSTGLQHCNL